LTMGVQKLVLEPYDSSRWVAELMSAGKSDKTEAGDVSDTPEDQVT